jgi:hypothetical protein
VAVWFLSWLVSWFRAKRDCPLKRLSGWLCLAGCITYGVIVVTVKLPDVGIAFIALTAGISLIFTFFAFLGLCLRLRIPNAPATKVDANAVVGNSAGPIPRPV